MGLRYSGLEWLKSLTVSIEMLAITLLDLEACTPSATGDTAQTGSGDLSLTAWPVVRNLKSASQAGSL
jgi:hypothetical protein